MAGRPTDFNAGLAAEICSRISEGESLNKICKDGKFPNKSTVFLWLSQAGVKDAPQEKRIFLDSYEKATVERAHHLAEEALEIADDSKADYVESGEEGAPPKYNPEHVQRSRLRVDTRKWFAGKVAPKHYGDKIQQEHSGPGGGAIVTETVVRPPISRDEWLRLHNKGGE